MVAPLCGTMIARSTFQVRNATGTCAFSCLRNHDRAINVSATITKQKQLLHAHGPRRPSFIELDSDYGRASIPPFALRRCSLRAICYLAMCLSVSYSAHLPYSPRALLPCAGTIQERTLLLPSRLDRAGCQCFQWLDPRDPVCSALIDPMPPPSYAWCCITHHWRWLLSLVVSCVATN